MAEAFRTLPLRQNLQSACCRTGWFRTDFYLQSRSILSKVRLHDEVIIADRCPNSLGIRFVCSGAESDGAKNRGPATNRSATEPRHYLFPRLEWRRNAPATRPDASGPRYAG